MSTKRPGHYTDFAKWTSMMKKLDNKLKHEHELLKKQTKEGDIRKSKKRIRDEEEEI